MKTFAQIKDNKVHWIFTGDSCPVFAPDIVIIDITKIKPLPAEGWGYDGSVFTLPPGPTEEQVRGRRDALIASSDWIVQRHRDELDSKVDASLTPAEYSAWMAYRQNLRDVSKQPGFPSAVIWPIL